ncbi:helicase HerA-like domain-containing protein [Kitasatospora sp. NPDC056327]|uniref:helicase HerA-like domain-containing protein n=1 Tax=Kitasatospora sp. NPDC056327 TaxID=3345785 RepID=UPI0035DF1907
MAALSPAGATGPLVPARSGIPGSTAGSGGGSATGTGPREAGPARDRLPPDMPQLLLSLLERRYLTGFDPARWRIDDPTPAAPRPLLHEVLALGRPDPAEEWGAALPRALTSCHGGGHLLSVAVHGDGTRHRFHWGGRRLVGVSSGSTEDYLHGQAGALRAQVPGLELGPPRHPDEEGHAELTAFLRTAPALALMTGIPAPAHGRHPAPFQSMDRLAAAVGDRRYAVVVAAEPLGAAELDATLDHCRRLRGEIHGLVRGTVSDQQGENSSGSVTEFRDDPEGLPALLTKVALFCAVAGALPGLAPVAGYAMPAGRLAAQVGGPRTSVQRTTGTSSSRTRSTDLLDATAEACERVLQQHIDRLESARAQGWWRTAVYLAADGEGTLEAVAGALRGICAGEATALDPLRVLRLPPAGLRGAALSGRVLRLTPADGGAGHPLGQVFDALATNVTSAELAVLVGPPRRPVAGLPVREVAEFALAVPAPGPAAVTVGRLRDARGREHQPVTLSGAALNRHVLITGMTGYGKTTTAKNLLLEAHTDLGVPFLVIEPAKAEYRRLADHPALRGGLRVYGVGPDAELPLRINPFVPVAGVPLSRHVDLLKAVFNASFPMFAGMSYVLEDAMIEVYTERGWDLHTSANDLLGPRPSAADLAALVPSIGDLHERIETVLERRGYGREVHQNLGAALRSRIGSLTVGTKGMALDTRRSVPLTELFERPAVIELRNLGDDEEKSFVMALLLCQLYEYAESRGGQDGGEERLRHLTLIEEAHRLLRASRAPSGGESADPQAKAVAMFTDMLAEMRAYGEGFVVADQVPTKLAPDVVKNSSVKILHRLVAADDRAVVAAAVNLDEAQSRHLGTLPPGVAVVHDERLGSAVLVGVRRPDAPASSTPAPGPGPAATDRGYLHRHGGCRHCPRPCTVLHRVERPAARAAADHALTPFLDGLLLSAPERLWESWTAWRAAAPAAEPGLTYCTFAQAAHHWLGTRLGPDPGLPPVPQAPAAAAPEDRGGLLLARDRADRALARLCADWLTAQRLDDAALLSLETARARLTGLIASAPPRELPGCAECPMRCRLRPLVAPAAASFATAVASCATRPVPLPTRLRQLDALAGEHLPDAGALLPPGPRARSALLYCMTVTATAGSPAPAAPASAAAGPLAETLAALRTAPGAP